MVHHEKEVYSILESGTRLWGQMNSKASSDELSTFAHFIQSAANYLSFNAPILIAQVSTSSKDDWPFESESFYPDSGFKLYQEKDEYEYYSEIGNEKTRLLKAGQSAWLLKSGKILLVTTAYFSRFACASSSSYRFDTEQSIIDPKDFRPEPNQCRQTIKNICSTLFEYYKVLYNQNKNKMQVITDWLDQM
jgi:hypothetical protein